MKKIMIVDDNCLSVEGIQKNIDWESLDSSVIHIRFDGTSAIQAMEEDPVDIIISDIEMPDLDGISMSKLAIGFNPFVKIILISAYDRFDYARRALRIGVYDYIEKPIDYSYLAEKVRGACALIDQEKKNMELLNQSRPLMTEKFFRDLIHYSGKEAAYHLASYMEYLNLELDYKFFAVILLNVENASERKAHMGVAQYEILLYNIRDTLSRYCRIFDFHYVLKDFDGLTLILCQNSSNPDHFLQSVHKIASYVAEEYQNADVSLNIGIGNVVTDLWNVHLSHESAVHALEYRFFFPQKNVFNAREALGRNLTLEPFSDTGEEELIRLICQKDYPALEQWIKEFSSDLLKKYQTKNLVFIRIYSLLGRILKFLYELNIDAEELETSIIKAYSSLDTFTTSGQFFSWLYRICTMACHKLDTSLKAYHDTLCSSVLSYIKNNYESSDLCLHDIAKYVNVSPAYLSALFKKNTGVNISDIIASARIDAACQYLKNSALSLKEISEKCGYANQYYFSTSFKRKLGISPSAYREAETLDQNRS
ncbi:helix-turn-helix domain-containing protein [Lacrimispora brassicae]